jgi:hypothetical protein
MLLCVNDKTFRSAMLDKKKRGEKDKGAKAKFFCFNDRLWLAILLYLPPFGK